MTNIRFAHKINQEKTLEEILANNETLNKKNVLELARVETIGQLINIAEGFEVKGVNNEKIINYDTSVAASFILKKIKEILGKTPEECHEKSIAKVTHKIGNELIQSGEIENKVIGLYIQNIALEISNIHLRYQRLKKHHDAVKDPLTGLNNRRSISDELFKRIEKKKRTGVNTSILLIDIDFFKDINDKYGHNVGDKTLQEISKIFKREFRSTDTIGRWGGEEFIIIMPETNLDLAFQKANTLKSRVARELAENIKEIDLDITISIGVAETKAGDSNYSNIVERADDALYRAKENGRNRVYKETFDKNECINSCKECIDRYECDYSDKK